MRRLALMGLAWLLASMQPVAAQATATDVLALGWEPAFCRSHSRTAECRRLGAGSPAAKQLSLHGLWPEPFGRFYCGVSDPSLIAADEHSDWAALPTPTLSAAVASRLAQVMPGVQSGLERHEWFKHGSCFGGSADAYFGRAIELAGQVNDTVVRQVFVGSIGQVVSARAIRAAFDQAFGAGAGSRVKVLCSRGARPAIEEIDVAMAGDVAGSAPIGALILAAKPVAPGCAAGIVLAPGR